MYNSVQDYPIKNVQIYQFANGKYFVSFDANKVHETFSGSREEVLSKLALRVQRILRIR